MNLDDYFEAFREHETVTLVGPLCHTLGPITEPVIFVDGGSRFRKKNMGISVGDGDSYPEKLDIKLNPDKDFSDLAFALKHIPDWFNQVRLIGFLGKRRDHELFNLGEAHHFLYYRSAPGQMVFDQEVFAFSFGKWSFQRTGLFSVAAIENTKITLTGDCQYECSEPTEFKPLSSLGLSNVGHGTIYLECDKPVFVIFEESN